MAIPAAITDLSTTASSNPPSGSETVSEGDNQIRSAYSFIAQLHSEKAPKASPTFTGVPAAPTAAVDTNTTQLATTAYVVGQGYAKLASPTFTGTVTADVLTTTGNVTLGNATTDTVSVSGKFGVAVSSVSYPADIEADSAGFAVNVRYRDAGDAGFIRFSPNDGSTTLAAIGVSSGALQFDVNGSERMRITSGGLVRINDSGNTQFLNVGGNSASTGVPLGVHDTRSADGVSSVCTYFSRSASVVGSISTTNAATAFNTTSDYRLKNISGDLQGSGAFIDALQPRVGTWKVDGSPFVGFVAHELQAVSPMSVTGEKDGEQMQSVAYGSAELIANMVAELKSLRARVAALES